VECHVCGAPVKPGAAVYLGKGLLRHRGCAPGSKRYLSNPTLAEPYCALFGMTVQGFREKFMRKKTEEGPPDGRV